jgi:hypothetical protein
MQDMACHGIDETAGILAIQAGQGIAEIGEVVANPCPSLCGSQGPSISVKQVTAAYTGDMPAPARESGPGKASLRIPRTAVCRAAIVCATRRQLRENLFSNSAD